MYVYIGHKSGPIPHPHRELRRRRRPHRNPVRPCRPTGRDTDVRRTWVALSPVRPTRAPLGAFSWVRIARELETYRSDLTPLARLPPMAEPRSIGLRCRLRTYYHPLPNLFCQQR